MSGSRVHCAALKSKIMTAAEAAALIPAGANVGMSGFTGSGYPKAVPRRSPSAYEALHAPAKSSGSVCGRALRRRLNSMVRWPSVDGIELRLPYQSDPICRKRINAGEMDYIDIHLSQVAQFVWFGFLGQLDVSVVEVAGVLEDGRLIPSASVGNNKTWLDQAGKVILEVNSWQNAASRRHARHLLRHATCRPTASRSRS